MRDAQNNQITANEPADDVSTEKPEKKANVGDPSPPETESMGQPINVVKRTGDRRMFTGWGAGTY